jgi:hypothetical protein
VREGEEALVVVEPPVHGLQLRAQRVKPLEDRVELPVVEGLAIGHSAQFYGADGVRSLVACRSSNPSTSPAASIATSKGDAWRPRTNSWWISSETA